MRLKGKSLIAVVACVILMIPSSVFAIEGTTYYLGEGNQIRTDENYSGNKKIGTSDAHYGWNLGKFCISGYSGNPNTDDDDLVFLKNVGDKVSFSFLLEQDIDALNGNSSLTISSDKKAYDDAFGISEKSQTEFGRGMLLIKKTDYQNTVTYTYYQNYLEGVASGANTEIILFEEGDYEIALDYEICETHVNVGKVKTVPTYTRYQNRIAFKVRNGNCMVYPIDVSTGAELTNTSFTTSGFYIDVAKSRYLNVKIEKEEYVDATNSFVADTRFNRVATDGEAFTDEGLYIITVKNQYTDAETVKQIYVGADPVLQAYVTTGKDVAYIKELVSNGATINDDGTIDDSTIISETAEATTEVAESSVAEVETEVAVSESIEGKSNNAGKWIAIIAGIIVVVGAISAFVYFKKKPSAEEEPEEEKKA